MGRPKRGARIEAKFQKLKPKIATTKLREEKKKKPRKKNYLATLIITIILWLTLAILVYSTNPYTPGAILLFFTLLIPALFFTFSMVFINTRRGVLATILIILFLVLRYFDIGHIINFILLTALAITIEVYFTKNS